MPRNRITVSERRDIPTRSIHAAAKEGWDSKEVWDYLVLFSLFSAPRVVKEDSKAWQALQHLAFAGMSPEYLLGVIDRISVVAAGNRTKRRRQSWALPSGLSRRQLNALPQRIEGLAEQVERINAHKLFCPSSSLESIYLTKGLRRAAQRARRIPRIPAPYEWAISMSALPNALKAYAAQLRWRIDQVSALRRGPAKGTESDFEVKREVLELIARVRDVLGEYRWADLVNLLRPIVPGPRAWVEDAGALRSFYCQNKKMIVL